MLKVEIVCVDLGGCSLALSTSKANYQEFKANHTEVDTFWKRDLGPLVSSKYKYYQVQLVLDHIPKL